MLSPPPSQLARSHGCTCIGVCNTVGSTIARETEAGVYLHAGPEIGVASTKAFSAQIVCLSMIALKLAKERGQIGDEELKAKLILSTASHEGRLRD